MHMVKFKPAVTGRRPRFALVGCGRIAANHFSAFEQLRDRAELVAVCDIDPAAPNFGTNNIGNRNQSIYGDVLTVSP